MSRDRAVLLRCRVLFVVSCLAASPALLFAQTACTAGLAGPYPCNNVDLLSTLSVTQLSPGASSGNDGWGWTDPSNGREYAIVGLDNGTAFVDITVPTVPVLLGNLPTHTVNSLWRSVKVARDHAFIVSEAPDHGMQVFDLTQLRGLTGAPPATFTETAHYPQISGAHNVAVNDATGFVYIVGAHEGANPCAGGLHMVDISTPASPTFAGCFSADGYTHDVQCVVYNGPDTSYSGDELCFAANEDTVTIVDVSNKAAPVQVSRTGYAGASYTHQGWLTEDQRFLLVNDELDERDRGFNTRTHIFDVSNVDAPVYVGFYNGPTRAIDHNLYIRGSFVYESNYTAGLRILDITDVATGTLREVAFFDVYPADNSTTFHGTWNNYPFFTSGVVAISGIEQGLILVRPNLPPPGGAPDFNLSASPASVSVARGQAASYTVNVTPSGGFSAAVTLSCTGLPAGASCAFTPPTVTPAGAAATSTLSVSTTGVASAGAPAFGWTPLLAVGLVLLPGVRRRAPLAMLAVLVAAGALLACGGGGGGGRTTPPPQSFTVTVRGDSGGVQHTATVTLVVR